MVCHDPHLGHRGGGVGRRAAGALESTLHLRETFERRARDATTALAVRNVRSRAERPCRAVLRWRPMFACFPELAQNESRTSQSLSVLGAGGVDA